MSDSSTIARLVTLCEALAGRGLNLARVLTADQLEGAGISVPVAEQGLFLLLGNGGGAFWEQLEARGGDSDGSALADRLFEDREDHPIDLYSQALLSQALERHLPGVRFKILFPQNPQRRQHHDQLGSGSSPRHMPLQQLGRLAGWHQSSPLGSGMHPQWGLWYAYRVFVWLEIEPHALDDDPASVTHPLFYKESYKESDNESAKTSVSVPETAEPNTALSELCLTCASRACVTACPAKAILFGSNPDMQACAGYRCASDSDCADRCLAREACPVGSSVDDSSHPSYPRAQISYHYRVALESLRVWYAESEHKPSK